MGMAAGGVTVLAIGTVLASDVVTRRARSLLPHVSRLGGALLVLVGLYVGYYGVYELRLFFGGQTRTTRRSTAQDDCRGLLVKWVTAIGPVPFVVVLIPLVAG